MKNLKFNILLFLVFIFCPLIASTAITQTISYQGFLIGKSDNLPVNTPQDINFLFYSEETEGTSIYNENRCDVGVLNGRYEVEIGTSSGGIPESLFIDNPEIWLEVRIDPDNDCSGTYEPLQPRIKMQASPYAFNSLYASTAAAATPFFKADVIGTLDNTSYGAVTISSNLFVMGGISVGAISPGQTLAVAGIVESSTGGFKFPDGTLQITAAGETKWGVKVKGSEEDLYTLPGVGNVGLGSGDTPLAKLHVSSGAGETGNIFVVSTGVAGSFIDVFRVTGESQVYADNFHGYLTGAASDNVLKTGDTMTGQLTILGSSLTLINSNTAVANSLEITTTTSNNIYHFVVSTNGHIGMGRNAPQYLLHVDASSGTAGTVLAVSTGAVNVFEVKGNGDVIAQKFWGDGSELSDVISEDDSKVLKTGDTMTGQLTITGSSLTVSGEIYSASTITAGGEIYGSSITVEVANINQVLISSSGQFTSWGGTHYSIETTSGILVNNGIIEAPFYVGDGSLLSNVAGTDNTKLLKAGDNMTGKLHIVSSATEVYSLTLATAPVASDYSMVVTTQGNVGVQITNPSVPLHVYEQMRISLDTDEFGNAGIHLYPNAGNGYIRWADPSLSGGGGENIGVLGSISTGGSIWDLAYRAGASNMSNGVEVFRIKSPNSSGAQWKFGIGTDNPVEKFHVDANTLFGANLGSPILYVSTTNQGVGIGGTAITHELTVTGGIIASSSITANGGLYGEIMASSITLVGNLGLGMNDKLAKLEIRETGDEIYTVLIGTNPATTSDYDMVVTTQGKVGIGEDNPAQALHVSEAIRVGNENDITKNAFLHLRPGAGATYIKLESQILKNKGIIGFKGGQKDMLFCVQSSGLCGQNSEVIRIKDTGNMIIGGVADAYVPTRTLEVAGDFEATFLYGNGSNLTGIVTEANNHTISGKLNLTGDLTLSGSTLTVTGNAFSVGTSTFVVESGSVGIGVAAPLETLEVGGGIAHYSRTMAQLLSITPSQAGVTYFCSDCSPAKMVVSTGTAAGNFADIMGGVFE